VILAPHHLPIRIYYEDTDFSGFVYHARYLHFFERGRTEALRDLGIDQRALYESEDGPFAFVVRHLNITYLAPARMDDVLSVKTAIFKLGGAVIEMHQSLWREDQELARAEISLVFLAKTRPKRLPETLRAALEALLIA
jgi:acyl-CoA thioester hydrolase